MKVRGQVAGKVAGSVFDDTFCFASAITDGVGEAGKGSNFVKRLGIVVEVVITLDADGVEDRFLLVMNTLDRCSAFKFDQAAIAHLQLIARLILDCLKEAYCEKRDQN